MKHVITIHHHHSQKVHKKKPYQNQLCCLPCLCPLRRLAIWHVRAGRPILAIRITSWTISSLVISSLLATISSAICTTSRMIVSVSGMLLLYDLLHVHRHGRRSFIRWENTRVRDFGIPSHVASVMMSWSLTPMYPIRVEPRLSV